MGEQCDVQFLRKSGSMSRCSYTFVMILSKSKLCGACAPELKALASAALIRLLSETMVRTQGRGWIVIFGIALADEV